MINTGAWLMVFDVIVIASVKDQSFFVILVKLFNCR